MKTPQVSLTHVAKILGKRAQRARIQSRAKHAISYAVVERSLNDFVRDQTWVWYDDVFTEGES